MRKFQSIIIFFFLIPVFLVLASQIIFHSDNKILTFINGFTNKIEETELWSIENIENFNKRIIKDQAVNQKFVSKHNNLGTVAIQFTNFQKINNDYLIFKLVDKSSNKIIYENTYKVDQFNPDFPFTFGFPKITDSKGKVYEYEIKSKNGTKNNSVGLSDVKYFITKYDFSLETIKKRPIYGLELLIINISKIKYNNIQNFNIILFTYYIILFLFILKNKIILKLKKIVLTVKKTNPLIKIKRIIIKTYFIILKLFPLIVFLLTFLTSGYFSTIGTDPHHDGIMIKPALDVSRGLILFKDSFTQYGAFTTLIQSLAIKLFGEYLLTIRITTAFFYGLISVLIYHINRKFLSEILAFISCLIWLLLAPYYVLTFLPWSSVYALFFQCLSLYFILKYIENNNKQLILFAGISSGLVFWSKQNVGGYTIIASLISIILIFLLKKKKIKSMFDVLLKYIYGGILISLPFFIWLIFNGALIDWWKQSILFIFVFIESRSTISLINSLFPASVGPISVWSVIPIGTIIAFLKLTFQNKPNLIISIVSIFGLLSWMQYYPVTCLRHVYWAATPMIGIIIYLLFLLSNSIFQNKNILKYLLFIFLIMSIFYTDIKYRTEGGFKKFMSTYVKLENPQILNGMNLTKQESSFYEKSYKDIMDYKNENGDINLITIGPNALYVTFEKSTNFHPMYVNWGSTIYPNYYKIKDSYVENNKPLIFSIWGYIPPGYCKINDLINEIDTSFLVAPCKISN